MLAHVFAAGADEGAAEVVVVVEGAAAAAAAAVGSGADSSADHACDSSVGTERGASVRVPFAAAAAAGAERPRALRPPRSTARAFARPRVLSGPAPSRLGGRAAAASAAVVAFGFDEDFLGLETSSHCEIVPKEGDGG